MAAPPTGRQLIASYESKSADRKKRRLRFLKAVDYEERYGKVAAARRLFFFCRRAAAILRIYIWTECVAAKNCFNILRLLPIWFYFLT